MHKNQRHAEQEEQRLVSDTDENWLKSHCTSLQDFASYAGTTPFSEFDFDRLFENETAQNDFKAFYPMQFMVDNFTMDSPYAYPDDSDSCKRHRAP